MKLFICSVVAALSVITPVVAQQKPAEVKARQGQFQIISINLGILGDMARGKTEYSAEAAQAAADSLVGISMVNQSALWPENTDTMSIDGTRALPAIWENLPDVVSKWQDFGASAVALQAAAGTGKDAIGPLLGAMGGTCKSCHTAYREPR